MTVLPVAAGERVRMGWKNLYIVISIQWNAV